MREKADVRSSLVHCEVRDVCSFLTIFIAKVSIRKRAGRARENDVNAVLYFSFFIGGEERGAANVRSSLVECKVRVTC